MDKIFCGFRPIANHHIGGQNDKKGRKLFKTGHVLNVVEKENRCTGEVKLTGQVVSQTTFSNIYKVEMTLNSNRNIQSAMCTCKAGLSGKCRHICAVLHFVNSPSTTTSKTSVSREKGKSIHKQLLGYKKGTKMEQLFHKSSSDDKIDDIKPIDVSTTMLGKSFQNTQLFRILQLEEKNQVENMEADTLTNSKYLDEKRNLQIKCREIAREIYISSKLETPID